MVPPPPPTTPIPPGPHAARHPPAPYPIDGRPTQAPHGQTPRRAPHRQRTDDSRSAAWARCAPHDAHATGDSAGGRTTRSGGGGVMTDAVGAGAAAAAAEGVVAASAAAGAAAAPAPPLSAMLRAVSSAPPGRPVSAISTRPSSGLVRGGCTTPQRRRWCRWRGRRRPHRWSVLPGGGCQVDATSVATRRCGRQAPAAEPPPLSSSARAARDSCALPGAPDTPRPTPAPPPLSHSLQGWMDNCAGAHRRRDQPTQHGHWVLYCRAGRAVYGSVRRL